MQARFVDPVLGDTDEEPGQSFADFLKKVDRSRALLPLSDSGMSTYVTYEPLERSFVKRLAIKLAHSLEMNARGHGRAAESLQTTPETIKDEIFDIPERLAAARENIFDQSVLANAVIANMSDLCDRQREQIECQQNQLRTSKKHTSSGDTKILEAYKKILATMAWFGYRFNPFLSRNEATKAILDDLEKLGFKLDDQTVLARLREAFELLPEDGRQLLMAAVKPVKANSP
jgi:hypothetical protein